MVNTIKFSQFATANLATPTNMLVGINSDTGGINIQTPFPVIWSTATRPSPPFNGLLGYNSSLDAIEFWNGAMWVQLGAGDTGTVTQINTGTGLTGGPIITTGTISFAAIAANSLWANITGGVAVPTVIPTSTFLISANNLSDVPSPSTARTNLGLAIGVNVEAWSVLLDEIAAGTWPGATSITTLGTIAFGTWQGSTITVPFGGTGDTSFTAFSVICGGTTSTGALQNVSGLGTTGQVLTSNGPGLLPTWQVNAASGTVNPGLINQLAYYAASGSTLSGLATAANGVLITSAGSVPSISSTLPLAVQSNITQLGTQTQALNMGTHLINNVVDPVAAQDAATKNYVDTVASGLNPIPGVQAATTANLTAIYLNGVGGVGATLTNAGAQAAFAVDGYSGVLNDRILIKNQTSTFANGIYNISVVGSGVTNWVLTRSTDYDTPAEIQIGDLVIVVNGTVNAGSSWIQTASVTTVGTSPILFSAFFTPSTFLKVANNLSDVANANTSFNNISPLTTKGDLLSFSTVNARLAVGGTNGQILQVASAAATGLAWSTATYPATTTINQLLFSSATNQIAGLATGNNGILVTSGAGLPSIATTFGQGLALASSVLSVGGANNIPFNNGQGIQDNNGNPLLLFTVTASAVNYLNVTNNSTTNAPILSALGTDTNVLLQLKGKGTSGVGIQGTTTNSNAVSGNVGELVSSVVPLISAISLTAAVVANVTSISLTAGDWDVFGNVFFTANVGYQYGFAWTSLTSATQPDPSLLIGNYPTSANQAQGGVHTAFFRVSIASTTTVYLSCNALFAGGTCTACGAIYARRRR